MGLTGVILSATVQLHPVETSLMSVDTERAADLDDLMARLTATDHRYRYSVAWIDLLARGRALGRSVLSRGEHAPLDALPPRARRTPLAFRPGRCRPPPHSYRKGCSDAPPSGSSTSSGTAGRPARAPASCRRLRPSSTRWTASRTGTGSTAAAASSSTSSSSGTGRRRPCAGSCGGSRGAGCPSFLAVLKRFGAGDPGWLSFPLPGWTLALDIPARLPGLGALPGRAGRGGRGGGRPGLPGEGLQAAPGTARRDVSTTARIPCPAGRSGPPRSLHLRPLPPLSL